MRISDWSSDVCSSDLITMMAAEVMRRLNIEPKVALLSRSNFGTGSSASGEKMREAVKLVRARDPELEIDGEMHGDCALDPALRERSEGSRAGKEGASTCK